MSAILTTYALDAAPGAPSGSPLQWNLEEAQITLPLNGVWLAVVRTVSTLGTLTSPAALAAAGAPGQIPTAPSASGKSFEAQPAAQGLTYSATGPFYDSSGAARWSQAQVPPWVYAGLSQYQPVTVTLGSQPFAGTVARVGLWRGAISLLIQAGPTRVNPFPGGGLNRVGQPVFELLKAVAGATHATLSPTIDVTQPQYAALLSTSLNFQPSATNRLSDTLNQLTQLLNTAAGPAWAQAQAGLYGNPSLWAASITPLPDLYHWRYLPDGTLWMGLDFYPSPTAAGTLTLAPPVAAMSSTTPDDSLVTWLDNRPQQGLETFGVTTPVLFPGDTYVSPQTPYGMPWPATPTASVACAIEYLWSRQRLLMTVLNGASSSPVNGVSATQGGGSAGAAGGW